MRIAYFDCPSGASGDMILGALVDAGVPFEGLRDELGKLPLEGYALERREVMRGAFRATKIEVRLTKADAHAGADRHPAAHRHSHRRLGDIQAILSGASIDDRVREQADRIFARLAAAEARVHGTAPEEVVFHDVGAVDAIVDIAGACIGLHLLGIGAVHCSALPVGGGFVDGPHGRMPVPAPGTAELLRGMPVVDTGVRRELVTPTGAAILSTLSTSAGSMPAMTVQAIGYGAGTMDLTTPNVVRLFVGEGPDGPAVADGSLETVYQVETTVDDMSPQLWEPLMERLLGAGALDVYLAPVIMKRSRPGVVLTALVHPVAVDAVSRTLLEESTTIGVRWTPYQRRRLPREMVSLPTAYGPLTFKVSHLEGRAVTATPEFAEVCRIARDRGLPVREVLDQARAEGRRLLDRQG